MAKYRKKPVVIEAIQWNGSNINEITEFVGKSLIYDVRGFKPYISIRIKTLKGEMRVSENDFIIKGINGEFYSCNPDIFEKTYERVE